MVGPKQIAQVARLIGDPTRARMLSRLMEGISLTAGELAREAEVTPQTASDHLEKLRAGGLIDVRREGRYRYARLASSEVAATLEQLGLLHPATPREVGTPPTLRFARTCYDHLAGRLAVDLASAMENRGLLVPSSGIWEVTEAGNLHLKGMGLDVSVLSEGRRPLSRQCLDWSERKPHLAGALGAALATRLFALKWVAKRGGTREVRLTLEGRAALGKQFGLHWDEGR